MGEVNEHRENRRCEERVDEHSEQTANVRSGQASKFHAVVDTNGLPVHLALTPGEAHDNRLCSVLLSALRFQSRLWQTVYQLP